MRTTCKIYALQKVSHTLHRHKVPLLPAVIHYFMRFAFAVSIRPSVQLGRGTHFSHWGMGTVIDDGVVIGENCAIGHHVTMSPTDGHHGTPVVGHNVLFGVGAKILGPVKIGDHAVIGANAAVQDDVPAHAIVFGIPARIVKYAQQSH